MFHDFLYALRVISALVLTPRLMSWLILSALNYLILLNCSDKRVEMDPVLSELYTNVCVRMLLILCACHFMSKTYPQVFAKQNGKSCSVEKVIKVFFCLARYMSFTHLNIVYPNMLFWACNPDSLATILQT